MDTDDLVREINVLRQKVHDLSNTVTVLQADAKTNSDFEVRLRWLERIAYSGLGAMLIIQWLVKR